MLSHELRNPLAPIISATQFLGLQKNEGPQQRKARSIIERQVEQMTRLIDDLLEVSRITTGKLNLELEPIALDGIVQRAIETVRSLIDKHRHELTVSSSRLPIWVYGDATRLEQVVVNLLTNAAKYTADGGQILLTGVVVVAMTGYGQDSDRQLSQEAGFDHHLMKPPNFDKLRQILTTAAKVVTTSMT